MAEVKKNTYNGVFFGIELELLLTPSGQYNPADDKEKVRAKVVDKIRKKKKLAEGSDGWILWGEKSIEELEEEDSGQVIYFRNEALAIWLAVEFEKYWNESAQAAQKNGLAFGHRQAIVSWGDTKADRNYTKWQFTEDQTIASNHKENKYGIEFVGPVMELQNNELSLKAVQAEIEWFYAFLTSRCHFTIEAGRGSGCSTHVHVSFGTKVTWTYEDVQRMASWAYLFEPAFNAILPTYRVTTNFARGFRQPPIAELLVLPAPKQPDQPFNPDQPRDDQVTSNIKKVRDYDTTLGNVIVDEAGIKSDISVLSKMNKDYIVYHYLVPPGVQCAWNFAYLSFFKATNIGTIEFRRPPGSATAADALRWIELVAAFALAACTTSLDGPPLWPSVKELAEFTRKQRAAGIGAHTSLDALFDANANRKLGETADAGVHDNAPAPPPSSKLPPPPPPPPKAKGMIKRKLSGTALELVQAVAQETGANKKDEVKQAITALETTYEEQRAAIDPAIKPSDDN